MAEISAALVKELRDQTGAPMMDCKRALQETNGDMEAAVRVLREKGMAGAAKRSDRETPEGKVGYRLADENKRGTMVAVGCETEPVSNNEEFLAFAEKVLKAVEADGPGAEAALDEERVLLAGKLGENIVVAGAARFEAIDGALIEGYAHPPANKLGVLVRGQLAHQRGHDRRPEVERPGDLLGGVAGRAEFADRLEDLSRVRSHDPGLPDCSLQRCPTRHWPALLPSAAWARP
jgi:elongation factor Ts